MSGMNQRRRGSMSWSAVLRGVPGRCRPPQGESRQFAEKSERKDGHITQKIADLREAQTKFHASLQGEVESQKSAVSRMAEEARSLSGRVSAGEQTEREGRDSVGRDAFRLSRACEELSTQVILSRYRGACESPKIGDHLRPIVHK
jgi:hypothetical protein